MVNCDCSSRIIRDSLIDKYLNNLVERVWYNTPQWQSVCDSVIAICPNIANAYELKAIPFIKYGDYAKAFPLEDKAVELAPKEYTAYRGFLKCIFTKDYEGAIIDFQKAQQLVPNSYEMDHTYFFYEGLCYLELGNYQKSEKNLKKDIFIQTVGDTTKTIHFNSFFYMGVLYYKMKNYKLAKEYLLKCISIYNEHPEANYYLAMIFKKKKDFPLEKKYLEISKKAFEGGYELNEDNIFYVNFPYQVTLYEVEMAMKGL
ncbi:MAG: tetratricopeptide repeat protein [Ginsengibacter sp.]